MLRPPSVGAWAPVEMPEALRASHALGLAGPWSRRTHLKFTSPYDKLVAVHLSCDHW